MLALLPAVQAKHTEIDVFQGKNLDYRSFWPTISADLKLRRTQPLGKPFYFHLSETGWFSSDI